MFSRNSLVLFNHFALWVHAIIWKFSINFVVDFSQAQLLTSSFAVGFDQPFYPFIV